MREKISVFLIMFFFFYICCQSAVIYDLIESPQDIIDALIGNSSQRQKVETKKTNQESNWDSRQKVTILKKRGQQVDQWFKYYVPSLISSIRNDLFYEFCLTLEQREELLQKLARYEKDFNDLRGVYQLIKADLDSHFSQSKTYSKGEVNQGFEYLDRIGREAKKIMRQLEKIVEEAELQHLKNSGQYKMAQLKPDGNLSIGLFLLTIYHPLTRFWKYV